jgi:hypothetical protein
MFGCADEFACYRRDPVDPVTSKCGGVKAMGVNPYESPETKNADAQAGMREPLKKPTSLLSMTCLLGVIVGIWAAADSVQRIVDPFDPSQKTLTGRHRDSVQQIMAILGPWKVTVHRPGKRGTGPCFRIRVYSPKAPSGRKMDQSPAGL